MVKATVLLLSSDPSLMESCEGVVGSVGALGLITLPLGGDAVSYLGRKDLALILVHVVAKRDAEKAGRLLCSVASMSRPVPTIVLTEQHDLEQALSLLRQGAVDFLSRPLDLSRLTFLVDTLTVRARLAPRRSDAAPEAAPPVGNEPFFSADCAEALMAQVQQVAPQDTTLLLGGETGTGKTRLARIIHDLSPRRAQPFVVIHCGALAPSLMESEMFGHVRGAFTGADRDRPGKLADAGSGTLVLDDIDCLPLSLQAKLLRAIEERVYEPVGCNVSLPLRARLIAASNRALDHEVQAGRFRADLFYRLNVIAFRLPPLRDCPGMIPELALGFLREFVLRAGCQVRGIAPEALQLLQSYRWPGNIRELRNIIERAVALCPDAEIHVRDFPHTVQSAAHSANDGLQETGDVPAASRLDDVREQAEAAYILDALRRHGNNRLRAAADLGISRMTLYNKLRKYGLLDPA
jgi:two-component system response regulator HydG